MLGRGLRGTARGWPGHRSTDQHGQGGLRASRAEGTQTDGQQGAQRDCVNDVSMGSEASEGHITYVHVEVFDATEGLQCVAVRNFHVEGALHVDPCTNFLCKVFPDDDDL